MVDKAKIFRIAFTELAFFEMQPYKGKEFNKILDFDIELGSKINRERNFVLYKSQVRIREKGTENIFASISVDTVYELNEFDTIVKSLKDAEFSIDVEINKILSRIAIGVTRGYLSAQLQKTPISHAVLPLLPVEIQ